MLEQKQLKVLIGSSSSPDRGSGISAYAKELSEALILQGVKIYFSSPIPDDYSWINQHNIEFIPSSQNDIPREKCFELLKFVNDNNIDAIINNDNPYIQSIAPVVKCVFISVGHLNRYVIASLAVFNNQYVDYVVSISNEMHSFFCDKHKLMPHKCVLVYNGVKDMVCSNQKSKYEKIKVLYAGGYNKRKGSDLILSAVLQNHDKWEGISLDWYGHVPDKIVNLCKNLDYVNFHGSVVRDEYLKRLSDYDVFLLPSREEGCPMALLEAMSWGLVPIASDGIGAMKCIIDSGLDGYVCSIKSWNIHMFDCLAKLRDNHQLLCDIKVRARNKFLANFDSKFLAKKMIFLISRPNVIRQNMPSKVKILKWHRMLPVGQKKASIVSRICYRLGILLKSEVIDV